MIDKKANIDIAVLILFFVRPETLKQVFAEVKKARPARLYLFQDGAREGRKDDKGNIQKCRDIVSNIDWDCELHTNYQSKNLGCDPSVYVSIKWFFDKEEMGIILEDDVVPAQSFFPFCKELLERYRNDERIYCISGMNHLGKYGDNYADYLFARNQSIWGWATWRRCIQGWDKQLSFLDDSYAMGQLYQKYPQNMMKKTEKTCTWHRNSGKEYFESIGWAYQNCNNMLNIVPTKNMISNIGIGLNGTHGGSNLKDYPKSLQKIFFMKKYELKGKLRHPSYMIEDISYDKKLRLINGNGHPVIQYFRGWEYGIRRFVNCSHGERKEKIKRLPKTLLGLLGLGKR